MTAARPPRLGRVLPLLLAFGLIVGPGVTWMVDEVDRGQAELGGFGLLLAVLVMVVRPLAKELEDSVFGIDHGPWLDGRLSRGQRLLLPYSSALYLTQGLSMSFGGGAYLITASPGLTAVDLLAIGFAAVGGVLVGFGFGRLLAGIIIIRSAGLWAAPRWAWRLGAVVVIGFALLAGIRSVLLVESLSPVF